MKTARGWSCSWMATHRRPVSSLELDTAIAGYQRTASITDAEALSFQLLGHTFYVLRFPSANATWLYDLTTDMWTEAGTWNSAKGDYDVWSRAFISTRSGASTLSAATARASCR
jgi:hypothetical protein